MNNINNNINNINKTKNDEEAFKKFMGQNFPKNGFKECAYCSKYFSQDFCIESSCPHCWGFCFSNLFDPINFTYNGESSIDNVKNYLKNTYSGHPKSCNNPDCVYNKINKCYKDKKLNNELAYLLGFIEEEKKNEDKPKQLSISNKTRDLNINFNTSVIYL